MKKLQKSLSPKFKPSMNSKGELNEDVINEYRSLEEPLPEFSNKKHLDHLHEIQKKFEHTKLPTKSA